MATTQPNRHPVFVDSDGHAIELFVETNVRNRTKLIRSILKQGGTVVHDPSKADILIAESTSKEVRDIIDAWGKDKVLLDTGWIYRCLETGKLIGKDQSWGGHSLESVVASRAFNHQDSDDDGEGEEEEEDSNEESEHEGDQNQVPSSTLSRSKRQIVQTISPRKRATKKVSKSQTHPRKDLSPPNIKTSDSPPPAKKRRLDENPHNNPGPSETALYPLQGFPASQSPSFPSPPPANFAASQYAHAPSPSTSTLPQSTQDICAAVGHSVLSSPEYVRYLGPIINQILSQAPSTNPEVVATQLRDIAEVISASNSSNQQYSQMPPSTQPPSFIDSATSRSDTTGPNPPSPRSEVEIESTVVTSTHSHRAGSLLSSDDGTHRPTGAWRLPSKERENNEKKTSAVQQQQHKGFLSSPDGKPSRFYVDMDLKNRRDLLNIVKKNGGVIVNLMEEGDYVILNDRSPQFSKRSHLVPPNKLATSPKWLEECARRNVLVPPQDYILEITSPKKQRSKPASKTASTSKSTESPSPSVRQTFKRPSQRMRSPSPPVHIATMSNDNYGFTEQEKEWFIRYITFKWTRDPTITDSALINAIADKAPHHSNNNWRLAYHRIWATEVKDVREEMGLPT